jgi:hypothetical protein
MSSGVTVIRRRSHTTWEPADEPVIHSVVLPSLPLASGPLAARMARHSGLCFFQCALVFPTEQYAAVLQPEQYLAEPVWHVTTIAYSVPCNILIVFANLQEFACLLAR